MGCFSASTWVFLDADRLTPSRFPEGFVFVCSVGRDTCRHRVSRLPGLSHSPRVSRLFGIPGSIQGVEVAGVGGGACLQPRPTGETRGPANGAGAGGEAWLCPCPAHTSQNRKRQPELWKRELKRQMRGPTCQGSHYTGQDFPPTSLKTPFPLSLRTHFAESCPSSLLRPH